MRVAERRQRRKAQQRGLADRDVRREVVADRQGPSCDIANGVAVAGWIHSALTVGQASAWLWWWYQAVRHRRQRGVAAQERKQRQRLQRRRHQAPLHARQLQQVRPSELQRGWTSPAPSPRASSSRRTRARTARSSSWPSTAAPSTVSVPITISGGTTTPASMTPNVTDVEQQPRRQDRGHGERWFLHRLARRPERDDVRRQVTARPTLGGGTMSVSRASLAGNRLAFAAITGLLALAAACGGQTQSGGSGGSGGAASGSGGSSGSGGATGTGGGSTGSGGSTSGSGGANASGGATGTGGAVSSGGATGSGGAAGGKVAAVAAVDRRPRAARPEPVAPSEQAARADTARRARAARPERAVPRAPPDRAAARPRAP